MAYLAPQPLLTLSWKCISSYHQLSCFNSLSWCHRCCYCHLCCYCGCVDLIWILVFFILSDLLLFCSILDTEICSILDIWHLKQVLISVFWRSHTPASNDTPLSPNTQHSLHTIALHGNNNPVKVLHLFSS